MWLEVRWAVQDLPGGSACCLVPLSKGGSWGHPCSSLLLQHPWVTPAAFPARCVSLSAACACSPLSPLSSPLSPLPSLSLPAFCLTRVALIRVVHKAQVPTPLLLDLSLHPGDSGVPSSHVGHAGIGESLGSPPSCPPLPPPSLWAERQGQVPGDALQARQRELGHRESHKEGPRVPRSPGGGSETPMERPREQGEVLGGLWAH